MDSLAGLFLLNLYQEHELLEDANLEPESRLFLPLVKPHKRRHAGIPGYKLPNAEKLAAK